MAPGWNSLIEALPNAHILQTLQWAEVKAHNNWKPYYLTWGPSGELSDAQDPGEFDGSEQVSAAALVLRRAISAPGLSSRASVMYAPKGPLLDWSNRVLRGQVLQDLHSYARRLGAIFLKIDPDLRLGTGIPGEPDAQNDPLGAEVSAELSGSGWHFSAEQIQFRNTFQLDLTKPAETLLAAMKQKTRYNIRLAERKGVKVRAGSTDDLDLLYSLYAETSLRDGFVIRDKEYYQAVWSTMMAAGLAEPLIAEVDGEPAGGMILFRFAGKAWYFYGMSRDVHREKMYTYLLQWEGIRRSQQAGCQVYDFWGAPDDFTSSDPMWGVYRFKEGFGGQVVRHLGAWDLPINPLLYKMYVQILPKVLAGMRRRGQERTQQTLTKE